MEGIRGNKKWTIIRYDGTTAGQAGAGTRVWSRAGIVVPFVVVRRRTGGRVAPRGKACRHAAEGNVIIVCLGYGAYCSGDNGVVDGEYMVLPVLMWFHARRLGPPLGGDT